MEPRIAKLEALAEATKERMDRLDGRMDRLDGDMRTLLKVMIGGFVLTWSAFAIGFLSLNSGLSTQSRELSARIEAVHSDLSARMTAIQSDLLTRQDNLAGKMDRNHAAVLDKLDRMASSSTTVQDR